MELANKDNVIKNIRNFNEEIKRYSSSESSESVKTLVNNLSHYRAWYCLYDEELKTYLFAPSKYIGYKGMNAQTYHEYNNRGMDGRKTESVLGQWYEQISKNHPKYNELKQQLDFFCSSFGKRPNSLSRINIVLDRKREDSLEDDIVELVWKIYLGLTKKNKDLLKIKINKFRSEEE